MTSRRQFVCGCILMGVVAVLFLLPAYTIEPTALRAWTSSVSLLAALSTLVIFAIARPTTSMRFVAVSEQRHASSPDRLRLNCALLC